MTEQPLSHRASALPLISVVVPIYDVERYLEGCLASIAAQSVRDIEVICVDDGSTDRSGEIADAYAAVDGRFRVLHQANAGLGAARNAGAAQARGEFLAFVDSDDLLPPDAYARLHAALEASGSDFAVGDIRRLTSLGVRASPTFSPIYQPARTATHVTRDHALLRDRIAPNKLYRRRFWTEHALAFPVGVLYEDISVMIPAHVLARSVDVIDAPVYLWRIRDGADRSITQRRLELRAIRDRVAAVTSASRFLADGGFDAEKRAYDELVLTDDLRLFARLLDRADPAFVEVFLAETRGFLAQAHPDALAGAPAIERLRWALVRDGSAEEVAEIARFVRTEGKERPAVVVRGGHVEGDLPFRRGRRPRLPRELFRYDQELKLQTRVTGYEVDADRIVIDGWAHLRHVEVPTPEVRKRLRMWLTLDGGDETIELAVEPRATPEATARGVPDLYDVTGAGFRASVPTAELARRWTSGVDRWKVAVEVSGGAAVRTGLLTGPEPGAARRPPTVDVGKLRVGPRVDDDVISIVVAARPVVLERAEVDRDWLRLELLSRRELTHLRLRRPGVDDLQVPLEAMGTDRFKARIVAGELTSDALVTRSYTVHAIDASGKAARLLADDQLDQRSIPDRSMELTLDITRYGYVALVVRAASLWLEDAALQDGDGFRLRARFTGADPAALRVELTPRDRIDPRLLTVTPQLDGTLEITVPATSRPVGEPTGALEPRPLPAGVWPLTAWVATPTGDRREVDVRTTRSLVGSLPLTLRVDGKQLHLDDRSWQQPAVNVTDDLAIGEQGRFNQRRLWGVASSGSRRRLERAVVIAEDGSGSGSCARAVYEELRRRDADLPVLWGIRDRQTTPPAGANTVRMGGREWHEALARSAAIVADGPLPRHFERASRQRCVRLWSGVPIRPVGADAPGVVGAELPADAARAWSHLVTAGPTASAVLARAFAFDGQTLPVGLPRHDLLADPAAAAARAAAVRSRLGIPDDVPIVLHLPTWVDGDRHPGGALRLTSDVDLAALKQVAGPAGWVLARAHPATVDTVAASHVDTRVLDVSRFPDVVALMLAADVVVAHPSSVVLEAVRCGVPVVVHDPAGAGIATQLGTPYRDLVGPSVPWPVARTSDELRDLLDAALERAGRVDGAGGVVGTGGPAVHGEVTTGTAASAVVDLLLS